VLWPLATHGRSEGWVQRRSPSGVQGKEFSALLSQLKQLPKQIIENLNVKIVWSANTGLCRQHVMLKSAMAMATVAIPVAPPLA